MYILDKFDNNTYYLDLIKPYLEQYLREYRREVYIRLIRSPRKKIIRELNSYRYYCNPICIPTKMIYNKKLNYFETHEIIYNTEYKIIPYFKGMGYAYLKTLIFKYTLPII